MIGDGKVEIGGKKMKQSGYDEKSLKGKIKGKGGFKRKGG